MNHRRLKKLGAISNAALLLALAGGSTLSGSAHAYDINSDVTVTPAQPQFWPTSEDLNIGYGAPGSLTISGGAQVTSGTWSDIGVATLGSVTVTGGGSRWNAGFVTIGQNNGDGTLAITNGGTVVANGVGTGSSFGAATVGRIIVDGASSLLDIRQIDPSQAGSGGLFLGNPTTVGSNSFLEITNQGTVSSDRGYLGYGFGSTAAVMIDGANSQWSNANEFSVGYGGSGQLTVQDGGRLTTSSGTIGSLSGASGTVLVTGSGSTWSNTGSLTIGNAGQGALTIAEQGSVSAATTVLGASSTGNGRLELYGNLVGRGVLTTSQITRGAGQGSILFNGGMVRATTDQADFLSGFQSGDIELHGDGLLIDTGGHNVGINAPMRGSGGLTKQGSGTLTLSTASSYTEGTIISGGQIIARSTGALGTGDVVVNGLGAALTFEGPNVSAGSRSITLTNAGWLYFNGSADAGTSRIHLDLDTSDITFSRAEFRGSSSAAGATILNEVTPMKVALAFLDDSNAGHATILNRDGSWAGFAHSASASNATITNESRGAARFEDSTTAGAAVITNRAAGFTVFTGSSSAGEAVLTNESGGAIYFSGLASGANARVINHAGGILEIANLSGAGTTLGSLKELVHSGWAPND